MEAIRVMANEIETLGTAVAEMRQHFDQLIHDTIIPKMDRLESKVDAVDARVRETNGRVRTIEVWRARVEGGAAVAGRSWQGILAVGGIAIAIISVVMANT